MTKVWLKTDFQKSPKCYRSFGNLQKIEEEGKFATRELRVHGKTSDKFTV